jgi:hypothetical protein
MEVPAMSLSAHDQQALDSIENRLVGSDPRLASLLATFGRLAAGEELPVRERIRAGWRRVSCRPPGRWRRPRQGVRQGLPARCLRRQLVLPLLWLAISVALIAVALAIGQGGKGGCTQWASVCSAPAPAAAQAGQAASGSAAGQPPRNPG